MGARDAPSCPLLHKTCYPPGDFLLSYQQRMECACPLSSHHKKKEKTKIPRCSRVMKGVSRDKQATALYLNQENSLKPQGCNFFKKHHFLRKSVVFVHSGFSCL